MGQFLSLEAVFAHRILRSGFVRLFSIITGHKKAIIKTV